MILGHNSQSKLIFKGNFWIMAIFYGHIMDEFCHFTDEFNHFYFDAML